MLDASTQLPGLLKTLKLDLDKQLLERQSEMIRTNALIFGLYKFSAMSSEKVKISPKIIRDLNDRLVGLVPKMSPKQLYRVFYVQTRFPKRHAPILRAIAFHLRQPEQLEALQPVHLLNILFTCSEMKAAEPILVSKVVEQVKKHYKEYSPLNLLALSKSVGALMLDDKVLIENLMKSGLDLKDRSLLANTMLACGTNGLKCDTLEMKVDDLMVDFKQNFEKSNPSLWLRLVWSLFALRLDKISTKLESYVEPLFTNDFANALANEYKGQCPYKCWLQLANIHAVCKREHLKIFNNLPQEPVFMQKLGQTDTKIERPQYDLCLNTFGNFCDAKKYVTLDKDTGGGTPVGKLVELDFFSFFHIFFVLNRISSLR